MERLSVWIQFCGFVLTQGSNDFGGGIRNEGTLTLSNSTVSGNSATSGSAILSYDAVSSEPASVTLSNSLFDGECDGAIVSGGYNIESPGNTCGFDQPGDQASVPDPMLGPLQNNGGPTETHALEEGSPAINQIPQADCELTSDQRGEPRPETGGTLCDVGAFELQP